MFQRVSGLPTLAAARETATNRYFDLITMKMIVRSREKHVKSDRRCSHLQKNVKTKGIWVAKKARGLTTWKSGRPFLLESIKSFCVGYATQKLLIDWTKTLRGSPILHFFKNIYYSTKI
jgi:hypothetical protein